MGLRVQGMLVSIPEETLVWNQGDHVGVAEISEALTVARPEPERMSLEGDRELWAGVARLPRPRGRACGIVVW